jgi:hypothetical protein
MNKDRDYEYETEVFDSYDGEFLSPLHRQFLVDSLPCDWINRDEIRNWLEKEYPQMLKEAEEINAQVFKEDLNHAEKLLQADESLAFTNTECNKACVLPEILAKKQGRTIQALNQAWESNDKLIINEEEEEGLQTQLEVNASKSLFQLVLDWFSSVFYNNDLSRLKTQAKRELLNLLKNDQSISISDNDLNNKLSITGLWKGYIDDATDPADLAQKKLKVLNDITKLKVEEKELEKKKGYSRNNIEEVKRWNLLWGKNVHIPNLNDQWRRGVVKRLTVEGIVEGFCDDLIVFLVPSHRTAIDEHSLARIDNLLQIEYSQGFSEEVKQSNNRIVNSVIKNFLKDSSDKWEWDVYVLIEKLTDCEARESIVEHFNGTSADLTFYLALTSTYLEIPLSNKVAITGTTELSYLEWELRKLESAICSSYSNSKELELKKKIDDIKKTSISQWKVKAVDGIKAKVIAAVEKGAEIIILPEENKDDYEEVPDDTKKRIEAVFIQEIKDLDMFLRIRWLEWIFEQILEQKKYDDAAVLYDNVSKLLQIYVGSTTDKFEKKLEKVLDHLDNLLEKKVQTAQEPKDQQYQVQILQPASKSWKF